MIASPASPVIVKIAEEHSQSPAQVMLGWHLQEGRSVIPKSTKPHPIAENYDVMDLELSADEVAAIDALDTGRRAGELRPTHPRGLRTATSLTRCGGAPTCC